MTILEDHLRHHKHIARLYKEAFASIEGITYHDNPNSDFDSNFWLSTIVLDDNLQVKNEESAYEQTITGAVGGAAGVTHAVKSAHTASEPNNNVEALRLYLDERGIESRPLWKPMHLQPVFKDASAYTNGVSENLFKRGLCLPSGPMVTDEDVRFIIDSIKSAIL